MDTTGIQCFAECLWHSAKTFLHSAKALPSVTLGKEHTAKFTSAKALCRVFFIGHSAKTLLSAEKTLDKD
jgi:hypothetical protein